MEDIIDWEIGEIDWYPKTWEQRIERKLNEILEKINGFT